MAGLPKPHFNHTVDTTTTTTTSTATRPSTTAIQRTKPFLDLGYVRSLSGIFKIAELVLDFITFICCIAGPAPTESDVGWATFVSITAFIVTLVLLIMYLFHVIELTTGLPWLLLEFVYSMIWVLFYVIGSSLMAVKAATYMNCAAYGAAAFFGYLAMAAYGVDGIMKLFAWRSGQLAQGTPSMVTVGRGH